jgi:hypothetical protein
VSAFNPAELAQGTVVQATGLAKKGLSLTDVSDQMLSGDPQMINRNACGIWLVGNAVKFTTERSNHH